MIDGEAKGRFLLPKTFAHAVVAYLVKRYSERGDNNLGGRSYRSSATLRKRAEYPYRFGLRCITTARFARRSLT